MRTLRVAPLALGAALFLSSPSTTFAQTAPPSTADGPLNADSLYDFLMARHLEALGDAKGAEGELERAAKEDPQSAEVRAELAAYHLRRDEDDAAEMNAKAALQIDPDNSEAHRVLGLLYAGRADDAGRGQAAQADMYVREAIANLEKVTDNPEGLTDINLQYTLGRLYTRAAMTGDRAMARKAVQALTRVI